MARSILGRSIHTMRPAPILVWPTSELPICPSGRPTALPQAVRVEFGAPAISASKVGVCAWATALPSRSGRRPHPSRITSTTGFGMAEVGASVILRLLNLGGD